jgi:hypothetical protein
MLTLFIYSIALIHFFWIYDYILINAELVISLSLSIVFFYLYIILRASLLFVFFNIMDSIYYIYIFLFILNIITSFISKFYLDNLNKIVKNIIKSLFLFLTLFLLNVKVIVWNIYDYFKFIVKTYYIFFDIKFLGVTIFDKKSYINNELNIDFYNTFLLKGFFCYLNNILNSTLKKNKKSVNKKNINYVS